MEEDFSITLNLLREQKLNIIKQLDNALSLEEKNKILNMIYEIDDKIYNTSKKYEELKKSKISENSEMNKNTNRIKEKKNNKPDAKIKSNKNINIDAFDLNSEEVEEIINKNNYIPIKHIDKESNITTIYKYKNKCKNFIYYICSERNKCYGRGKIDIKEKKFFITDKCDNKINHNNISYEEFFQIMKNKEYNKLLFNERQIQKFYAQLLITDNNNIDNPTIKKNFFELTNIPLKLSLTDLSRIRNNIIDNYENLDLENLISKIKIENEEILIKIIDMKYLYKRKSKNINREQRVFIFGVKENLELLNYKLTQQIFIDSTFKIIPPKFRPYKLTVIAGIANNTNIPNILAFILIKYLDEIAYDKILNFLNEFFYFKPKFIMSDFEAALAAAIKKNKVTKNDTIHLKCIFHFSQMLIKKLYKCGFCKRKLNKKTVEILRNIQMLLFIKKENIEKYENIIIEKLGI